MLGLPEAGVRDRAHAALAALAPDRIAPVGEDGAVADWILGQQDDEEAERTAESVARMPAWHAWASDVTDRLSEVDGAEIPELPEPGSRAREAPGHEEERHRQAPAPRARRHRGQGRARRAPPRPGRARCATAVTRRRAAPARAAGEPSESSPAGGGLPLRSSRLGGALVIGALVLIVGVFLAWFLTRDDDGGTKNASATPTATATATPRVVNEVTLKGVGNKAQGLMRVFQREQDGKLVFALAADNVPKNKAQEVYAVWFTKKGGRAPQPRLRADPGGRQQRLHHRRPAAGPGDRLREVARRLRQGDRGPRVGRRGVVEEAGTGRAAGHAARRAELACGARPRGPARRAASAACSARRASPCSATGWSPSRSPSRCSSWAASAHRGRDRAGRAHAADGGLPAARRRGRRPRVAARGHGRRRPRAPRQPGAARRAADRGRRRGVDASPCWRA